MQRERDAWLSTMLGYEAFRVTGPWGDGGDEPPADGRSLEWGRVPTEAVGDLHRLEASGFRVVDTALTFGWEGERVPEPVEGSPVVRRAAPEDREVVVAIAAGVFRYSRFHLDPLISDEAADRIKGEWIANYFRGERGDGLLVAEVDGEVAGFLGTLVRPGEDGEVPRAVLDLIGVGGGFQGRGVGTALTRAFVSGYRAGHRLVVGTQAANLPSARLYERMGFRLRESAFVVHRHRGSTGVEA